MLSFCDEARGYIVWRRRGVSATSVNRELNVAKEWKIIKTVPRIKLLGGERQRDFVLNHEQERRYLEAAPEPLKTAAVLLLDTGLRVGECLNLRKEDVHIEPAGKARYGWVHVRSGKTRSAKRDVSMTGRVIFSSGPADQGSVFTVVVPRRVGRAAFACYQPCPRPCPGLPAGLWEEAALSVPKGVRPPLHEAYHTCLIRLGEAGTDAFTIMKLAGHSSVTVSQRYVHPTPEAAERAFDRLEALNRLALEPPKGQILPTKSPHRVEMSP